ncbi:lysophosphatidylserine lipase ABHD12 isoform X1 [Diabrotica virgifera virgifera]|uniref:AB hydrolase-1 domain-containing protein n=1 Tax=Diabrotica virgifera virgifera TaxID=50390 RepID=A0ABM5IIT9_DIAVI|nr:lysophosphatidylserine lipase ABHD12 isoform X1 [Diabrotica virgifera virgifera]
MADTPKTDNSELLRSKWKKCKGWFKYIFVLLLLIFLIVFVVVPVVFKYSVGIQRSIIFPSWVIDPKNYSNIDQFGIKGVKNFYVNLQEDDNSTLNNAENITLGVWQILPHEMLSELIDNNDYNYDGVLSNGNYSVLLYMHGNGQDRTDSVGTYEVLRKFFHIFSVDYRSYGDSTKGELTEANVVDDMVKFYKWLQLRTNSKIYVWGHSLGTGVGTHLLANLKNENISTTKGLVLETPFTSVTDVMLTHPIIKMFSWLPWFRSTLIQPMIDNDFNFDSAKHILDVDCPIMIVHAKDDDIIPYSFATELYNIAINNRDYSYQGNVTYHLLEAHGYRHMWIYKSPDLPIYTGNFIDECEDFDNKLD